MSSQNPPVDRINQSLIEKIRKATGALHGKLEAHPVSQMIMNSSLTIPGYMFYLGLMKEVVADYETNIIPLIKSTSYTLLPSKKQLIESDLIYLEKQGYKIPALTQFQFPFQNNNAYLTGIAYVMEGSALGGRIIYKHISQNLELSSQNGASYFYGNGELTGRMWIQFLELMSSHAKCSSEEVEMISGAQNAFNSIFDYFTNHSIPYEA